MASSPDESRALSGGPAIVRAGNALADLLFPPICAGCGIRSDRHGGVCAECWTRLRFIERPLCDVMGTPFAFSMGDGIVSAEAIADPPPFSKARSVLLYDDLARSFVHRLKYKDRTELGRIMGTWMARAGSDVIEPAEAVVPVPLHWRRRFSRRYNQAAELARVVAERSGKPMLAAALLRRKNTKHQVGLGANARRDNLRGAFEVPERAMDRIFGRRLLLVDDVYTTGATVKSAARALRKAGAADVAVLTFARVAVA